jgi:hypothetical protein
MTSLGANSIRLCIRTVLIRRHDKTKGQHSATTFGPTSRPVAQCRDRPQIEGGAGMALLLFVEVG